jgi:hypothetical protein
MKKLLKKLSIACNLYYYLIPDSLKTVYFAHFQSLLQFGINFCSSPTNLYKALIEQKRKIRVMLALRQRTSCGQRFKKLRIVTVPRLYIIETLMFVVEYPEKFEINVSNHSRDIRQITDYI